MLRGGRGSEQHMLLHHLISSAVACGVTISPCITVASESLDASGRQSEMQIDAGMEPGEPGQRWKQGSLRAPEHVGTIASLPEQTTTCMLDRGTAGGKQHVPRFAYAFAGLHMVMVQCMPE